MIREKHECSLLLVSSDVGSTPTASTTHNFFCINSYNTLYSVALVALHLVAQHTENSAVTTLGRS